MSLIGSFTDNVNMNNCIHDQLYVQTQDTGKMTTLLQKQKLSWIVINYSFIERYKYLSSDFQTVNLIISLLIMSAKLYICKCLSTEHEARADGHFFSSSEINS